MDRHKDFLEAVSFQRFTFRAPDVRVLLAPFLGGGRPADVPSLRHGTKVLVLLDFVALFAVVPSELLFPPILGEVLDKIVDGLFDAHLGAPLLREIILVLFDRLEFGRGEVVCLTLHPEIPSLHATRSITVWRDFFSGGTRPNPLASRERQSCGRMG